MNEKIDPKTIKELLDYDEKTGTLYWKERDIKWFTNKTYHRIWNNKFVGKEAGRKNKNGYKEVGILYKLYSYHHVVWAFVHGEWPKNTIDHINGNRSDNRIHNLRLATDSENKRNRGPQKNNTTGFKGVSCKPNKKTKQYTANIWCDNKIKYLGYFDTPEEAALAYNKEAVKLHKDFAVLNQV